MIVNNNVNQKQEFPEYLFDKDPKTLPIFNTFRKYEEFQKQAMVDIN